MNTSPNLASFCAYALTLSAALAPLSALAAPRDAVTRDVQGYAIAVCLDRQENEVLKEQGNGWAAIIVERGKGDIEDWAPLRNAVEAALAEATVPVVRGDSGEHPMPLFQCAELIDDPIVAAEIDATIAKMKPAYGSP
ncbi:hypothetical protein [Rhizobium sp. AAP43]|uniref:hypothetical protein n=1 Tax=Rhizobium sp. AAP43 TaxID=1523420 RepID=UPI0006B95B51|nr:hypothetical protein [Rhizobium sp. AAP43]